MIETLRRIFEIALEESDVQRQAFNARSPRLWLAIAARTDILGALARRVRCWELVREIGLWRPPQLSVSYLASWIRAAMRTRSHESWPRRDGQQRTPKGGRRRRRRSTLLQGAEMRYLRPSGSKSYIEGWFESAYG